MLVKLAGGIRPRERSEVDTHVRVRALSFQHSHWQGVTFHPIQTKLHSAGEHDIIWPCLPRYYLVLHAHTLRFKLKLIYDYYVLFFCIKLELVLINVPFLSTCQQCFNIPATSLTIWRWVWSSWGQGRSPKVPPDWITGMHPAVNPSLISSVSVQLLKTHEQPYNYSLTLWVLD